MFRLSLQFFSDEKIFGLVGRGLLGVGVVFHSRKIYSLRRSVEESFRMIGWLDDQARRTDFTSPLKPICLVVD